MEREERGRTSSDAPMYVLCLTGMGALQCGVG